MAHARRGPEAEEITILTLAHLPSSSSSSSHLQPLDEFADMSRYGRAR